MEGWKVGRLENWNGRIMEIWKVEAKSVSKIPSFQFSNCQE
jgi:hypothetical protein